METRRTGKQKKTSYMNIRLLIGGQPVQETDRILGGVISTCAHCLAASPDYYIQSIAEVAARWPAGKHAKYYSLNLILRKCA